MQDVNETLTRALDLTDSSLERLLQFRLGIPLRTADAEDAIGMALGGAVHHLRSAVFLARSGRVQAAFVLLRAAHECIDACFFFRSKPPQAVNWITGKLPVVRHAASRKEISKSRGGHEDKRTRELADAFHDAQSAHVHPSYPVLLQNYYQLPGQPGLGFEPLNLGDNDLSRTTIVALIGALFYAWHTLAKVYPERRPIKIEERTTLEHYRSTAISFGFADPFPDP